MKEEFDNLVESQDPFGFDIFLSVELFHETISSLAGLYFQLWFTEQRKPAELINPDLAADYLKRHKEIRALKYSFKISEITERDKATEIYAKELKYLRDKYL